MTKEELGKVVVEKHNQDLDDHQKKLLIEGNFYIRKTLTGNLKIIFPLTKKDYPKKDSIKAQGFPWTNSPLFECTTRRIKIPSTTLLRGPEMSKQEIAKELLLKWRHELDLNQIEKLLTGKFFMKRVQASSGSKAFKLYFS